MGIICTGRLDKGALDYLQGCPSWADLAQQSSFRNSRKCVKSAEDAKGLKAEYPAIVDDVNPRVCRSLNSDKELEVIASERFAAFVRALRRL